ncbi:hypothetical protein HDV62DRAFT_386163 [Trichoderma sp. SZMC 28011]
MTAPAEGLGERQHSLVGHTLTRFPPALAEDEKGPEKRDAEALFRGTRPRDEMPKEFHVQVQPPTEQPGKWS